MHDNGGVDEAWLAKMFPSKCGGDCYIECSEHRKNLIFKCKRNCYMLIIEWAGV